MEEIREKIPMIIAIIVATTICVCAFYFFEGYDEIYYTQIDNSKLEKISGSDNMKYQYTLDCYKENGKKKEMQFKTSRELREGAYLKLGVRILGVHSWEEIEYENLPESVKTYYNQ